MITTSRTSAICISVALVVTCGVAFAQSPIRIEAEEMQLDTYRVESLNFASGGALINLKGPGFAGNATAPFPGASGRYDISVVYHDENDGLAQLSVSIDGDTLDVWTLDLQSSEAQPKEANRQTRQIAQAYSVDKGDEIVINGLQGNWDHANVDYMEFSEVGSYASAQETLVAKSNGDYDNPIDAMNDIDAWCSEPTTRDPCTMRVGPGIFEIEDVLSTRDAVSIVGAGQHATTLFRRASPSTDCSNPQPMIRHDQGRTIISDLSLQVQCNDSPAELILSVASASSITARHISFLPALRARIDGRVTLESALIEGGIIVDSGRILIFSSKLSGDVTVSSQSHVLFVDAIFLGPTDIDNQGEVEIDGSRVDGGYVVNTGTFKLMRSTWRGPGIRNQGALAIYGSVLTGENVEGDLYFGIENWGSRVVLSNTVVDSVFEVEDRAGTAECQFVSNVDAVELNSACERP